MAKNQIIISAARCIFPQGKAVLAGHDAQGKFVFGIGVKTKSVRQWTREGGGKADLARVLKGYKRWLAEAAN